jgi:hypothetical protein
MLKNRADKLKFRSSSIEPELMFGQFSVMFRRTLCWCGGRAVWLPF